MEANVSSWKQCATRRRWQTHAVLYVGGKGHYTASTGCPSVHRTGRGQRYREHEGKPLHFKLLSFFPFRNQFLSVSLCRCSTVSWFWPNNPLVQKKGPLQVKGAHFNLLHKSRWVAKWQDIKCDSSITQYPSNQRILLTLSKFWETEEEVSAAGDQSPPEQQFFVHNLIEIFQWPVPAIS